MIDPKKMTDDEWKNVLNDEQYNVLRKKATEAPFSGKLTANKETGMYACAACGAELFSSDTKFDSGSGWPSFWNSVNPQAIELKQDVSHGMIRTEVVCATCGGHLGHVFDDGPKDKSGQRYCINSASLNFEKK